MQSLIKYSCFNFRCDEEHSNEEMNGLGNSKADNERYDVLKDREE